jgi:F0F1-type ATP synthase membrane subunit c/vacuolar-type H+-ATPase subunit K
VPVEDVEVAFVLVAVFDVSGLEVDIAGIGLGVGVLIIIIGVGAGVTCKTVVEAVEQEPTTLFQSPFLIVTHQIAPVI